MSRTVTAVLLGAGVLVTTWVSAPAAPTAPVARVSEADLAMIEAMAPLAADVEQETARLRARLATVPERSEPGRDPFSFGRPARRVTRPAEAPALPAPPPAVDAAAELVWPTLAAVLAEGPADAPARTAVVGWGELVELLKPGDLFKDFRVIAVSTGALDLRHEPTGTLRTITLR